MGHFWFALTKTARKFKLQSKENRERTTLNILVNFYILKTGPQSRAFIYIKALYFGSITF
jgi:hypothetical protein